LGSAFATIARFNFFFFLLTAVFAFGAARFDFMPAAARRRAFHKVAGVEEAIQAVGASLRYLPQYSPDLNPIELLFHPLKTFLRKAAERTIEGLNRCVGSYIRTLDPSECMGYFRHTGYEPL
jgi:hypothetical protein